MKFIIFLYICFFFIKLKRYIISMNYSMYKTFYIMPCKIIFLGRFARGCATFGNWGCCRRQPRRRCAAGDILRSEASKWAFSQWFLRLCISHTHSIEAFIIWDVLRRSEPSRRRPRRRRASSLQPWRSARSCSCDRTGVLLVSTR